MWRELLLHYKPVMVKLVSPMIHVLLVQGCSIERLQCTSQRLMLFDLRVTARLGFQLCEAPRFSCPLLSFGCRKWLKNAVLIPSGPSRSRQLLVATVLDQLARHQRSRTCVQICCGVPGSNADL